MIKEIKIKNVTIGGNSPLALIAGPCVMENEAVVMKTAEELKKIAQKLKIGLVFKASYKKDNRSSAKSYQGPGLEAGLKLLEKVKKQFDVPVLSDVHYPEEVGPAAQVLDIIQIPAYLCMQTELTLKIAKTGKVVNIKKGQFLAPEDMGHIVKKIEETGNTNIILTERGSCFGYHNLVVDFKALPVMRSLGYPVVFDVTHTIRKYGKPSSDPAGGSPGVHRAAGSGRSGRGVRRHLHRNAPQALRGQMRCGQHAGAVEAGEVAGGFDRTGQSYEGIRLTTKTPRHNLMVFVSFPHFITFSVNSSGNPGLDARFHGHDNFPVLCLIEVKNR